MAEKEEEEEALHKIFERCESDPDAGLEFIKKAISENPDLESYVFLKFCKARAYQIKGVRPLQDNPGVNVGIAGLEELRSYINDENLNYLELALSEFRQIEDTDPGFLNNLWTKGPNHEDAMANILERCRPGRVQQILGKTKLNYFGVDRISTVPHLTDAEKLPPEELRPFLQIPFSFPSIVKSALVFETDRDAKGRKYILCWLFEKVFDDFGEDETYGDAMVGEIYLFDDGKIAHTLEEKNKEDDLAIILQHGQEITDDVSDEAMEIRVKSRLLTCVFAGRMIILTEIAKKDDTPESEYFGQFRSCFALGFIAAKEHNVVKLLDMDDPDIGNINDDFNSEEFEYCLKLCNTIERDEDGLANEPDEFLSKYIIAVDILKAISQMARFQRDDITKEVANGKLGASFVLGYTAAKYPERFKDLEGGEIGEGARKEPIRKEEPKKKGFFKKLIG